MTHIRSRVLHVASPVDGVSRAGELSPVLRMPARGTVRRVGETS
ncbi:MAG: hypothetical protein AAF170_03880 [Bacteroidota bacterium]